MRSNPYSSLTPLPRISPHVPSSQRQEATSEIRSPRAETRCVVPLGADSSQDVRWSDLSAARETSLIPARARLSWPLRIAAGGLALALLPLYLLDRATRRDQ